MAQTGFTPIQLYRTATASAVPLAGNLSDGELALNTNDGRLYYKDSGGTVQVIAYKNVPLSTVTGTLAVANGGTGQTTLQAAMNSLAGAVTSGQYLRGNGTNVVMSAIQAADVPTLNQNTTGTASNVTGTVAVANGGTGATTAPNARTNLGATTVGSNFFTLTNPSAVTFIRVNADNTVSTLDAATFRTAIGAGTGGGSVTSVSGTGTVQGLTLSGTVTSSGSLTLGGSLSAVSLTSQVSGTLPVANGGTGLTAAPTNGQIDIGSTGVGFVRTTLTQGSGVSITNGAGSITISATGSGGTVTSVGGTGSVNGITLSGTVTSSGNLTLGGTLSGVSLTSQVSGTLPIANGGTNSTATPTSGGVAYGTGTAFAFTSAGAAGQLLQSNGASAPSWVNAVVYPGAGIPVSTGSAWGTSLAAPSGALVGTTATQTLTNKTITDPIITLNGTNGDAGQVLVSTGTGTPPIWAGGTSALPPSLVQNTVPNNTVLFTDGQTTTVSSYPNLEFTSGPFVSLGPTQSWSSTQVQVSTSPTFATISNTLTYGSGTSTGLTFTVNNTQYASYFSTPADLTSAVVVYFRVRYLNSLGNYSPFSNVIALTVANFSSLTQARIQNATAGQRIMIGNQFGGSSGSGSTWGGFTGTAIVMVLGGGGAGSCDSFTSGAGGGGSGYIAVGAVSVTPSTSYSFVTGAQGTDAAQAGWTIYSNYDASSQPGPGSSSITIAGQTFTALGGQQGKLGTSINPVGGNGGCGGGGYSNSGYNNGGNRNTSTGYGTNPGRNTSPQAGLPLYSTAWGIAGTTDDSGKWVPGGGGAGFTLNVNGTQASSRGDQSNRVSGGGGGIAAGGGGVGRDQSYDITMMRPYAGGIMLLQKYW